MVSTFDVPNTIIRMRTTVANLHDIYEKIARDSATCDISGMLACGQVLQPWGHKVINFWAPSNFQALRQGRSSIDTALVQLRALSQ